MNQLHDGLIPKEKFMIKLFLDNLQFYFVCQKFHIIIWSLPINGESHNPWRIMLMWNLAPMEHIQEVM